jgi:hypothetical protein
MSNGEAAVIALFSEVESDFPETLSGRVPFTQSASLPSLRFWNQPPKRSKGFMENESVALVHARQFIAVANQPFDAANAEPIRL